MKMNKKSMNEEVKRKLERIERQVSKILGDYEHFLYSTAAHEAAHKTVGEALYPGCKFKYTMKSDFPTTSPVNQKQFDAFDDEAYQIALYKMCVWCMAGYAGEFNANEIWRDDAYKVLNLLFKHAKLSFENKVEETKTFDQVRTYESLHDEGYTDKQIKERFFAAAEDAKSILDECHKRFEHHYDRAWTYFRKKIVTK